MRRRGFTLTELLIAGAVITVLGAVALPIAYSERLALNEHQARGYLRMIQGAEAAWQRETGGYQQIGFIAVQAPLSREQRGPSLRTPLLPHSFLPYGEDDIGRRGGYRFDCGIAPGGRIKGCWGWPETPGYSGDEVYWIEFETGKLYRVPRVPQWKVLPAMPAPDPLAGELVEITN